MKKVLLLAVVALVAAAVPASAYTYNWSTGFEQSPYMPGHLTPTAVNTPGQGGWFLPDNPSYPSGTARPNVEHPMAVVPGAGIDGSQGIVEATGVSGASAEGVSMAARDMRGLNSNNSTYYRGWAKFWVYDAGYQGTAAPKVDARVGVYSHAGTASTSNMATAAIQDVSGGEVYWRAQFRWNVVPMNGVTPAPTAGLVWTAGPAAERQIGWNYVMVSWSFPKLPKPGSATGTSTGTIKFYVNQSTVNPNMTLTISQFLGTNGSSWTAFNQIAGLYMGDGMTTAPNNVPAVFDNVEFHADAIPEPSSLLALGTGMVGLLGLIRRRK